MKLLIATGNRHKFQEISTILKPSSLSLLNLRDLHEPPPVVEDGDTFEANAVIKAVVLARHSGMWTLSDDSGLMVDALGGAPGVMSARYAGEPSDDAANNRKLLKQMEQEVNRRARFCCAIALSDPCGISRTVRGACEGVLLPSLRGAGGFGYDPLFVPDGYDLTFAELSPEIKNVISHRARALALAVATWGPFLATEPVGW